MLWKVAISGKVANYVGAVYHGNSNPWPHKLYKEHLVYAFPYNQYIVFISGPKLKKEQTINIIPPGEQRWPRGEKLVTRLELPRS